MVTSRPQPAFIPSPSGEIVIFAVGVIAPLFQKHPSELGRKGTLDK